MIGRFLLGSGLGALVGTGLLAMASIFAPAPGAPQLPQTDEAMKAGDLPEASSEAEKAEPEAASQGAEAPKPADLPEEALPAPSSDGQAVAELAAPEAVEPPAPSDTDLAATSEPAAPQPEASAAPIPAESAPASLESEPPPAPVVADADAAPKVPETAEAPAAQVSPESPAGLNSDTSPQVTAPPAQAPEIAGTTAPDSPAPPAESAEIAAIPALLDQPEGKAAPGAPDAPLPEDAPASADLPAPPPLTPEEEALLRQLAEDSPGNAGPEGSPEGTPEVAVVVPEPAAPETAEPAPEESLPEPELADLPATDLPKDPEPAEAPEGPGSDDMVLKPDPEGSTLPPAPGLSDEAEGVTIGRLPRIGDAEPAPAAEAAASDKPLARYARPFENPEAKPLFAIVLIDDGAADLDRQALAALPFPVSFALDPTDPNAPAHAAIYRAAGQEVLMLATALPKGAVASDVEVALAAMEQALPETVAVLDTPERSFQADRPLAGLVVPVIGAQGRGVLTWDQGLNAADQVARREDVPSAVAFRDLDGAAEAATVIRRYLDRAAFKAAQEGRVTVIGRTRPDTVAAILEWTVEGRAATVALAPISAAMVGE